MWNGSTERAQTKKMVVIVAIAVSVLASPVSAADKPNEMHSAEALLAQKNWSAAVRAYRKLLKKSQSTPKKVAEIWYGLARAEHERGNMALARDAYANSIEAGYKPPPRVYLRLARVYMSLGQHEKALDQFELIGKLRVPLHRQVKATKEFLPLKGNERYDAALIAMTPCTDSQYRQFDFWLGPWVVTRAGAFAPTASSRISVAHDGCAILENYRAGTYTGQSINFYDNVRKTWHQSWMDNSGSAVYIEGGLNADGAMVLTDKDHAISKASGTINKVTWSPLDGGGVRQHWEVSTDSGKSWTTSFDGYYKRAKAEGKSPN